MLENLTLADRANSSNLPSNLNQQTEDGIFFLYPEFFNIILLTTLIGMMYNGIEIVHPIYKIVFCNLCVSLLSSFTSVATFLFIKTMRFSTMLNSINWCCILYHYTSWCILSVLRYLYIMHGNWLHKKIPEPKTIGNLGLAAIAVTYFLAVSVNILAAILLTGWPRKGLEEAPTAFLIIRTIVILVTFLLLLGVSCFFYAKILRHTAKVGNVEIAEPQLRKKETIQLNNLGAKSSDLGGIWMGEDSNSDEEDTHWKSLRSKIMPKNKVDIFVIQVSCKTSFYHHLLFSKTSTVF
jgi:hypothetical protein